VSGQPAVLQVVILRDGLLVGTEVFVPGSYVLGSSDDADLRPRRRGGGPAPRRPLLPERKGRRSRTRVGGRPLRQRAPGHRRARFARWTRWCSGPSSSRRECSGRATTPRPLRLPRCRRSSAAWRPRSSRRSPPSPRPGAPPRLRHLPAEPEATAPAPYSTRGPVANGQVDGPGTVPSARRRKGKAPKNEDEPLGPLPSSVALEPEFPPEPLTAPSPRAHALLPGARGTRPRRPGLLRRWQGARASRPPPPPPPGHRARGAGRSRRSGAGPPARAAHAGASARGPQLFAVTTKGGRGRRASTSSSTGRAPGRWRRASGPPSKKKPITSGLADVAMVPFYGFTMPEGFPVAESAGRGDLPAVPAAQGGAGQAPERRPLRARRHG
jgi:hypothetical protein